MLTKGTQFKVNQVIHHSSLTPNKRCLAPRCSTTPLNSYLLNFLPSFNPFLSQYPNLFNLVLLSASLPPRFFYLFSSYLISFVGSLTQILWGSLAEINYRSRLIAIFCEHENKKNTLIHFRQFGFCGAHQNWNAFNVCPK